MTLRVPTSTTYSRLERGLTVSLTRVQQLQAQLSSGNRITRMSDDPAGAAAALRMRAEQASWGAYNRAADDAQASIGLSDSTLNSVSTLLITARQLSVSGTNGSLNDAGRAAVADQIADLRTQIGDLANTQYLGRAVFGGHRAAAVSSSGTPPTYAYAGDDGTVSRQVAPSLTLPVNLDGRQVFGFAAGAGQDLFAVLGRLETAVRSGDPAAMADAQDQLATRTGDVTAALGQVGTLENRISTASAVGLSAVDRLTEQRSGIEDVDLAQTIMQLQMATNGYTAALGAVAKADLPSLANFLH